MGSISYKSMALGRGTLIVLLMLWICAVGAYPATAYSQSKSYTLGVFPYLPLRDLETVFAPIAAELSRQLGAEVRFRSASSYDAFVDQLREKAYDIAFIQPFDYVFAHDVAGYRPVAARDAPLSAIVVSVSADHVPTLEALRGKHLALPPEEAAVSRLVLSYLRTLGLEVGRDIMVRHYKSHMSCMHQLLIGNADACGSAVVPLNYFQRKMDTSLHVVGATPSITGPLFVVHSRLTEAQGQTIRSAILGLDETTEGRKLLDAGEFNRFIPASDNDYDVVRQLMGKE